MQAPTQLQDEIDALTQVAKRFSQRQLYSEAAELFHLAHELDPKNSGIKLALAEVRRMQRQYHDTRPRTARDAIREQLRRDAIDSAHFLGLAQLYAERGENVRAGECLEISKAKEPANPTGYKLMGRILARRRDYDGAAAQLTKALRFNPFDRESAEALGRAEYERRQFQRSLDATIHAFLLLNEGDTEGAQRLRRRIRTLRQILGLEHEDLVQRFHQQRDRLQIAFDRLQWHRERFLEEEGTVDTETAPPVGATADSRGLIELSGRIERLGALTTLSDDQIIRVARVVKEEFHERDSVIFEADTAEQDVFIIERGAMTLRSETSYGTFELRRLGPSSLFGESNFVTRLERAADAVAAEPTVLFRLDAGGLRQLVENDAELGVQLYWTFWHTLAAKLRAANEQMRTFFAEDARTGGPERREDGGRGVPRRVPVDSSDTIRLLREQGLSHGELMTLATFSRVRRFPAGSFLFREGDEGREMYVIVEGKARISKYIPGAGEEALAILSRGDFFGEMSLIDGQPRSADATSHDGPLTVLALDQETFREILSMDAHASLELLHLLCRLIARRLREIDSKLVSWRILAGPSSGAGGSDDTQEREVRLGA